MVFAMAEQSSRPNFRPYSLGYLGQMNLITVNWALRLLNWDGNYTNFAVRNVFVYVFQLDRAI
jgi:hypothetical protein